MVYESQSLNVYPHEKNTSNEQSQLLAVSIVQNIDFFKMMRNRSIEPQTKQENLPVMMH